MKQLKRFVMSLQDKKGGIAASHDEKSDPSNGWLVKHLIELQMENIAAKFQKYLLRTQNPDGSWQPSSNTCTIPTTANALKGLCDSGISNHDSAVENATKFILKNQHKNGGFPETIRNDPVGIEPNMELGWITATVVEALFDAGIRITTPAFDDAALFVRKCFWEYREGIEAQMIMLKSLRSTGFKVFIETKEMKRRIDALTPADNGGFPKINPNLNTTLNILAFLQDNGIEDKNTKFNNAVEFVALSRNNDGGWPNTPGSKSMLWTSLESAVLLRRLGKFS